MALKKGDRVQISIGPQTYHGFIRKAGAKAEMVLDDGRVTTQNAAVFSPSTAPIPEDSRFNPEVRKTGARVVFTDGEGKVVEGRIEKADPFTATVKTLDSIWKISTGLLSRPTTPDPVDPPTAMDAWSVRGFKDFPELSQETGAFSAEILHHGKKVLDAKNTGNGGCNSYYGDYSVQEQFFADAKAWAAALGDEDTFEPDSKWLQWAAEFKPLGFTATEFMEEYRRSMALMRGEEDQHQPGM